MKPGAIILMALAAPVWLIILVIAFLVHLPFQLYDFTRWFLDSRYTRR